MRLSRVVLVAMFVAMAPVYLPSATDTGLSLDPAVKMPILTDPAAMQKKHDAAIANGS